MIVAKAIEVNRTAKSRLRSSRALSVALLMALLIAIQLFPVGKSWAAGGYTYTQVRQFPSSDPNNPTGPAESLCDMAMNDLGQVAYVTSQANSDGTQTEHIHVWTNSGVDTVIYSGTTDVLGQPPTNYPYCGGTGGNSLGLAIDNRGVVSAQEWILMSVSPTNGNLYTYGLMFIDSGLVSGNTQYVISSQTIAYALTGNHANASGYRPYFSGSQSGNFLGAYSATSQLGPTDLGFYTDSQISYHPIPAINDAGQISLLAAQVEIATGYIGPLTLIDVAPTQGADPVYTVVGAPSWTAPGQLGMNKRGDAAFLTDDAFRLVVQPANRSTAPMVLADASTFTQSSANRPLSFSDSNEATFLTSDASGNQDIWSIGPDKTAVEVFSTLDTAINVYNPVTKMTSPLPIYGYGFSFASGNVGTATEIVANNQGAVLFPGPMLLVATPLPGLRPSAPLNPDLPTTNLMTFSAPCASFYSGSDFLTPALTFGSFTGTCYVYPALAANYTVNASSGADNFQSITIPAPLAGGQTTFGLSYVPSNAPLGTAPTTATLIAGQSYAFPAGGVSSFTILGINTTQALNSNNVSTFVVGLSWVKQGSAPTGFTMQSPTDNGPTITSAISGTTGNNGWYASNAVVTWTVTDPLNPILSESGCTNASVTADTIGQSFTCTASTAGGTTSKTVTIKRDATPPVATATPSPLPDAYGWNNSTVTVTFTGADSTSGIASCSLPVLVTTQGAAQSSSPGSCTDNAGNVSTPVAATGINIEETPPVVSDAITVSTPESPTGWYTAPVTVAFAGTDPLSGVAPGACTSVTLSQSGSSQTATGTCTNLAGDVGTLTVSGINIDLTIPVASYTAAPPPNANGWNNTPVTVTFTGTDSMNGSGVAACTAPISLTSTGAGQLASGTCTTVAGTVSASVTDTVNINLTPPTAVIVSPPNNAGYPLGANVIASYSCTTASQVPAQSCTGSVANGSPIGTATAGPQIFSVSSTDVAGNSTTASTNYLISTLTLTTPGSIWTVAGNGSEGFFGDGGAAASAEMVFPIGVAVDSAGNLYIGDAGNNRVRKVTSGGTISTVAGGGAEGGTDGDGGPATSASLVSPESIAIDSAGVIYIADTGHNRIRKISTDGTISAVAGSGALGFAGDGGPATSANLYYPSGVTLDAVGNLYIADTGNERIRKVATDGTISTVAGNGTSGFTGDGGVATNAELNQPSGVGIDSNGNLYIADYGNNRIRKVTIDGTIITVAGTGAQGFSGDGGPATSSSLSNPFAVIVDPAGSLIIADYGNQRIRKVLSNGTISTLAGDGAIGFSGDGGLAVNAALHLPINVAIDSTGNLYIADQFNQRIRLVPGASSVDTSPPVVTPTIAGNLGTNGWYVNNVTVTWTVTDPLAPIISQTGCSTTTISADTTGQVVTCTAVGQGGANTQSVMIKRDATPPTASANPSPVPNSNGWNNTAVTVNFSGTDSTSGIASCSGAVAMSAQGANQTSPTGTCKDNAGNVSAPVSATNINIDETPPVVSGSAAPAANGNGWNNTPVTVTFSATDSLSGVAQNGCQIPVVLSANGSAQSSTGTCSDRAGNSASATVSGINIDTIPPVATATATPAANAAGWNNSSVTVSFSGTDNLSGSGIASCSPNVLLTNSGAAQIATGGCGDKAGNSSPQIKATVSIDETPPAISITSPANGASYASGSIVNAAYTCADALSGVVTCVGTVGNGSPINTSTPGTMAFAVTGTDVAGNTAAGIVSYTVVAAAPGYTLAPNPLAFGAQALKTSTPLTITLSATGAAAVPITSIAVSGGNAGQFSQINTCGTSVAAGTTCTITVSFEPTTIGAKTSSIKVIAAGGAGTQSVTLSGTGVDSAYTINPTTLAFGGVADNAAATQILTISNSANVELPITSITLAGPNAGQFNILNSVPSGDFLCPIFGGAVPPSGTPGSVCEVVVQFLPTSAGNKTATLKVKSGGGAAGQSVTLSGTGIVPTYSLTPTTLGFGNQTHGTSSSPMLVTIANTGTLPVLITSTSVTGQFSQSINCGASVPPGNSCAIEVIFSPTNKGAKTGTLRVTAGGGAANATVSLTGTGT